MHPAALCLILSRITSNTSTPSAKSSSNNAARYAGQTTLHKVRAVGCSNRADHASRRMCDLPEKDLHVRVPELYYTCAKAFPEHVQ